MHLHGIRTVTAENQYPQGHLKGNILAADPQRELHITRMRLQHLLQFDLIRAFDEKDIKTGEYVRDIKLLDQIVPYGELR